MAEPLLSASTGLDAPRGGDQTPRRIRSMFEQITPTYDGLNLLFSGALDRRWRSALARELTRGLDPCARVLDVATGTGDLARAVRRQTSNASRVTGIDFTRAMLARAGEKFGRDGHDWIEGDGLRLPFATGTFDACCIGFGLRNMVDRPAGLAEMRRVLRPGGRIGILECSRPRNPLIRGFYDLYSFGIMPRVGLWISGSKAYRYLSESIREFWPPDELKRQMELAGFVNVRAIALTFGVVHIHIGEVPAHG
jgi:demethylmenaquinone methyltransferase/2-methoxy-6-polyprenyl-1,4-benzoquinol methylase